MPTWPTRVVLREKRAKSGARRARPKGRVWAHTALDVASRFVIEQRAGPRTLEMTCELGASVAICCGAARPLLLIDDRPPYPATNREVYGLIKHRRRRHRGRGRKHKPTLKPRPRLLVGVVKKVRGARGYLIKVTSKALFGCLTDIQARIRQLSIGWRINTSHLERLNGTLRTQQRRLTRRTRNLSKQHARLQWSLWLWRDLHN